jgi:serine palmitoyltransferase
MRCLNLGSYNYLGFADDWKVSCRKQVMESVDNWPLSLCSARVDTGTISLHEQLEKTVAEFLGKEAAVVYAMGYDTNASTIPAIIGPESLIISDSLNHTSIVNGSRSSHSQIRVFRHNDMLHLEQVLREAIVNGQPRHHRPWKKIMVMVEGIYSMEGDICDLKEVVRICKKYKAYLYVDEAHSIGALGKTGRGVCEYAGVDPNDVGKLVFLIKVLF